MESRNIAVSILLILVLIRAALGVEEMKVGVMGMTGFGSPYDIERIGPAIDMAFERVNTEILNSSYRLKKIEKHFGSVCSAARAPGIAADLFYHDEIVALIGPGCAYALAPTARLAGYWNIPVVTGLGDGGGFKNKTDYPTLTRLAYCQCRLRKVFGSVLSNFNWTDVALIYDQDDVHSDVLGTTLYNGLQKGKIYPYKIGYFGKQEKDFSKLLMEAREKARVNILIAPGDSVRQFMLAAYDLGYIDGDFVYMDVELFPFPGEYWGVHDWFRGDARDDDAKKAYEALLRISLHQPTGPRWQNFTQIVKQKALVMYNFSYSNEEVNFFVGAFYDAVLLYGMAINESLDAGINVSDGYTVTRRMWDRTFTGITEDVFIDDNGDRDTSYSILDMDPNTGKFQVVANYWGDRPAYNPVDGMYIHWPGGRIYPPTNTPRCGFKGDNPICDPPEQLSMELVVVIALLSVLFLCLIIGLLAYKKYRWEKDLRDMLWRIDYTKIKMTSISTKGSIGTLESTKLSVRSDATTNTDTSAQQNYTTVGVFRGEVIAVKKVNKTYIELNRRVLTELKQARDISHNNLVRFIGACVDPPNICLATEYCKKGSLQDLLANDQINLDWSFRLSLMRDLVMGMRYIHLSELRYHGRLSSSNCVVDGRFVLKLTDYGLHSFHEEENEDSEVYRHNAKLLYRAPEQLRMSKSSAGGSPKGDVYSFGIILEEILTRAGPYDVACTTLSPQEIALKVCAGENPPFRPIIDNSSCPKSAVDLAHKCWSENPEDRPDFSTIHQELRSCTGGKEKNIMDTLLDRMEQYATNLEAIVEDRTVELMREKRKAEELLHQILPRSIAEQLKQGNQVVPESFDCVSLYFSDIVGFTALSSESKPLQVVALLNDLYTLFDDILDTYDVYKVETIGDAYMVVSGLPERNGDRHALEIARMSLSLLTGIKSFRIRHRPHEQLKLRVGTHSGPCVAGVVGQKMPRYCLFGDTVNTTSRMESNGEALRIHVSQQMKALLDGFGTFQTELRGEMEMKGKGMQTTYWLLGESDHLEC